jgi:queuine/archaeosine tRNA-ribosyltransferase
MPRSTIIQRLRGDDPVADICIVYARPNKTVVRKLCEILCQHYSVWWDELIHSGDYRGEIEYQLQSAKCVIPVWCRISRSDEDVIDEASFAKRRGITLLPVKLDDIEPPLGFGNLQSVSLIGWSGNRESSQIGELLSSLERSIGSRPRLLPRAESFVIGGREFGLPLFFRSVSSHETHLSPEAAIRALRLLTPDALLVSAYDIVNESKDSAKNMISDLESCRSAGTVVLLDSGNYEAYRKADKNWSPEQLAKAFDVTPHDVAFCFDDLQPPAEVETTVTRIIEAINRDAKRTRGAILPIVHAPRHADGQLISSLLPHVIKRVARELQPTLIAVPERELGIGVLERAKMVHLIRRSLDELGFYQPVHLLGTGNPLSIAVFAAVGADCFDGLEWCRTVADSQSGTLYHFQQYDFFAWQDELAGSPIAQAAARSSEIGYAGKVVFHNLDFFAAWMSELRAHMRNGKVERLLSAKLPGGTSGMRTLEAAVPEVFG